MIASPEEICLYSVSDQPAGPTCSASGCRGWGGGLGHRIFVQRSVFAKDIIYG